MSTQLVEVLKSELQAVGRELDDVRAQEDGVKLEMAERLRSLSETRMRLEARLRHIQALLALEGHPVESDAVGPGVVLPSPDGGSLADTAYQLLAETRQEYHYQELAAELQLRGVRIPGKEPANNLVAHIHGDPRFVRPKRGVYGLAEWYPKGTQSVGTRKRKVKSGRRRRLGSAARRREP